MIAYAKLKDVFNKKRLMEISLFLSFIMPSQLNTNE